MHTRKKIAVVTPYHWSNEYGGAEYQISLLIGEIAKLRPDLDVFYVCKASDKHIAPKDHSIVELAPAKWYSKYGSFFDALSLYATLKKLDPDYIYQRVGCSYTGICAYYARSYKKNMVWHIALDLDVKPEPIKILFRKPHHWLEKKLLEYGLRHSPRIVAQKQSQSDDMKRYYSREADAVIANFQPVPEFNKNQDTVPHVIWVANLKVQKNPEIFIDLAEKISEHTQAQFTMVGRPSDSEWGKAVVARANQSPHVDYRGELKQDELNILMESAHIMVNTSDFEGFPNTFIQSWMRELPVVSLYVDPDNLLTEKGIGVLCKSQENLYLQTLDLIQDREMRQRMAKTARLYAIKAHSLKNAEGVISLLTEN